MSMLNEQNELPRPVIAEAVMTAQGKTPQSLLTYFRALYTGSNVDSSSEKIERLEQSAIDDVVFATMRGHTKPSKYLCMGLDLKKLEAGKCWKY